MTMRRKWPGRSAIHSWSRAPGSEQDPNWGRLADAAGYSGAALEEDHLDIDYGDIPAMINGRPQHERKPEWKQVVSAPRFTITIRLNLGPGQFRIRASDLTDGYVNFNRSE